MGLVLSASLIALAVATIIALVCIAYKKSKKFLD